MSRTARALLAGALFLFLAGCQAPSKWQEYVFQGDAMGTSFSVKVVSGELSDEALNGLRDAIQDELESVNQRMSTYLESSELSALNRHPGGAPFVVSPELLTVLTASREIGEVTGGAFDITVAPLVEAWGFGPSGQPERTPTDAEIADLSSRAGWDELEIEDAAATVTKSGPAVCCDLSGIAKGYAVDRVSERLVDLGQARHMVEVGGEVRVSGHNQSGGPWRIAIERPDVAVRGIHRVLDLRDMAMATSGDYRNFYEADGVRLSHIIDPRTGRPIRHRLASVTVVEQFCTQADGYATALMVLGENEGYELASTNDLAALFLIRGLDGTYSEKRTPRFAALFGGSETSTEQ